MSFFPAAVLLKQNDAFASAIQSDGLRTKGSGA